MSRLGSDGWLSADVHEDEPELRDRATAFVAAVKWNELSSIASRQRNGTACHLSEKYSLGQFNLVRRIIFKDGVSWIVRLRLPELESFFGHREALGVEECMEIEIATMRYLRLNTSIPVPELFGHNFNADNSVGARYILMSYIHGTTAEELQTAQNCEPGVFGTPAQDARFWEQMASIQVQLASLKFDRIGSLRWSQGGSKFTVGAEIETGKGPWDTPESYYSDLVRHKLDVADKDAAPKVRESKAYLYPKSFAVLMRLYASSGKQYYSLVNRDFGTHNVLVDEDFSIVGLIDFDGVMAAPAEVVAQFPLFMGITRPIPGHVETRKLALERIKRLNHLLPRYITLVRAAISKEEDRIGREDTSKLADLLMSDGASVVQGLIEFSQHQDFVNQSWTAAYDLLLRRKGVAIQLSSGMKTCTDETADCPGQ